MGSLFRGRSRFSGRKAPSGNTDSGAASSCRGASFPRLLLSFAFLFFLEGVPNVRSESLLEALPNSSKELKMRLSSEGGKFFFIDEVVRTRENKLGIWSDDEGGTQKVANDGRFSGARPPQIAGRQQLSYKTCYLVYHLPEMRYLEADRWVDEQNIPVFDIKEVCTRQVPAL